MKRKFENINLRSKTKAYIELANQIITEYQADGLTLTLRQLYYQFVARGWLENSKQSYQNLGKAISSGRLAGLVDWEAIEDRTRFLRGNTTFNSPKEMIEYYSGGYRIPMWDNQQFIPEVWIEKDALVGVIDSVCRKYDVNYFACRGYVSQSELYSAGRRLAHYNMMGQTPIVIHLGDHDPSGVDMTRDNEDRLRMFSGIHDLKVQRIALNMDQIEKYSPPPNPAKLTDARAKGYIAEYGHESWELDALEPRVLRELIEDKINDYRDLDAWDEAEDLWLGHKNELRKIADQLED